MWMSVYVKKIRSYNAICMTSVWIEQHFIGTNARSDFPKVAANTHIHTVSIARSVRIYPTAARHVYCVPTDTFGPCLSSMPRPVKNHVIKNKNIVRYSRHLLQSEGAKISNRFRIRARRMTVWSRDRLKCCVASWTVSDTSVCLESPS